MGTEKQITALIWVVIVFNLVTLLPDILQIRVDRAQTEAIINFSRQYSTLLSGQTVQGREMITGVTAVQGAVRDVKEAADVAAEAANTAANKANAAAVEAKAGRAAVTDSLFALKKQVKEVGKVKVVKVPMPVILSAPVAGARGEGPVRRGPPR